MKTSVIQFLDKKDIRPLPTIPDALVAEMHQLIDTRINAKGLALFERLAAIYSFFDRYNTFVSTFAVCQKGCSHCCRFDINVSRLEAEYITINSGPELDLGINRTAGHNGPCTFLAKDGSCSIYERRPFNCRTFHALDDPKYCASGDVDHQIYGSAGMGYGVTIYAQLAAWLKSIHDENNLPYRDIRDWFPMKQQRSLIDRLLRRGRM